MRSPLLELSGTRWSSLSAVEASALISYGQVSRRGVSRLTRERLRPRTSGPWTLWAEPLCCCRRRAGCLLLPCRRSAFGSAEPIIWACHEDDAALVATVVCRRGAAADRRAGCTRRCRFVGSWRRPASTRVGPTCSGGDHLLVQQLPVDSVWPITRGGLRCRLRGIRAPALGALEARLGAVVAGCRRAGRCDRSATAGLGCRGGRRLRCPPPTGKLAAMIASNSTCRSRASAQITSANATATPLVVVVRCPLAARSSVGWSVMAVALPVGAGTRWGQALICLRSVSVLPVMLILRGLAFSAIGIRRVSTPAS